MNTITQLARLSAYQCRYKQAGQPSKGLSRVEKLIRGAPDTPTPKVKPKPKPTGVPHVKIHVPPADVPTDLPLQTAPRGELPASHVPTPGTPTQFGSPVAQKKPLLVKIKDVVKKPVDNWQMQTRAEMGLAPDQSIRANLLKYMSGATGPRAKKNDGILRDYSIPLTKSDKAKAFFWPQLPNTMGGKAVPYGLTTLGLYEGAGRPTIDAASEVLKVYNDPISYFDVQAKKSFGGLMLGGVAAGLTPERQRDLESRARDSFEFIVQSSVKDYFGIGEPPKTMADKAVFGGFREAVWDAGSYAAGQGLQKTPPPSFGFGSAGQLMRGAGPYLIGQSAASMTREGLKFYATSRKPDFAELMQKNLEKGYAPILKQLSLGTADDGVQQQWTPQLLTAVVKDYVRSDVHTHLSNMSEAFEGMNPEEMIVEVGRKHGYSREQVLAAYEAAKIAAAAAAAEAARRAAGGVMSGGGTPSRSQIITRGSK